MGDWSEEVAETQTKLLEAVRTAADKETNSSSLLRLAEAFAWAAFPNQAHGGSNAYQGGK